MTIYLLRHGDIESGGRKRFIGQTDVPLTQKGRAQAAMWQEMFETKRLDMIYTSNLARCADTARTIAGCRSVPVKPVPEFREIHLGKLEGLAMDDVRKQLPDEWKQRGENMTTYRPDGGESFEDLKRRVVPVFDAIAGKHEGDILIVAHAGVNRIILCHILGIPLSNLFRIEQSYGCLNILEAFENTYRVTGLNLNNFT